MKKQYTIGALLALLLALTSCAQAQEEESATSSPTATASDDCTFEGKKAICGVVKKTYYDPAGFWPAGWSMVVITDGSKTLYVEGDVGSSAEELHKIITVGVRVAYTLGGDDYLDADDIEVRQ